MKGRPPARPAGGRPGVLAGVSELIRVEGLSTHYSTGEGEVRAVDNVSLRIRRGEAVALVGESGSGKSTTAFSMMGLVSRPGRIVGGKILLDGRDILSLDKTELSRIRGGEMSMVFQEPMTFLNPLIRVGEQIAEAVRIHQGVSVGRGTRARRRGAADGAASQPGDRRRLLPAPVERRG